MPRASGHGGNRRLTPDSMKQTLQLKLSQHLTLTPQLQQSIRLLQLSTIELNQELERYLAENPLLERADLEEGSSAPPPANGSAPEQEREREQERDQEAPQQSEHRDERPDF